MKSLHLASQARRAKDGLLDGHVRRFSIGCAFRHIQDAPHIAACWRPADRWRFPHWYEGMLCGNDGVLSAAEALLLYSYGS